MTNSHQEQVPRKQGLKHLEARRPMELSAHQEQVPRKQGLKHRYYSCHPPDEVIKSKFHENKD